MNCVERLFLQPRGQRRRRRRRRAMTPGRSYSSAEATPSASPSTSASSSETSKQQQTQQQVLPPMIVAGVERDHRQTLFARTSSSIVSTIHTTRKDSFIPKHDHRMDYIMGPVDADDDIWIERFYTNQRGRQVSYFRSYRTRRCVLLEPPTGSSVIVLWNELSEYPFLHDLATEELERPLKEFLERPCYHGLTYYERQQQQQQEQEQQE